MSNVWLKSGTSRNMFPEPGTTSGTGTSPWINKDSPHTSYQAVVSGTGVVSSTVVIEYSNDGINALSTVGGTITLSGTTVNSDGFVSSSAPWKFHRARVTTISGTGATLQVYYGV
jgi:hypothetical protein